MALPTSGPEVGPRQRIDKDSAIASWLDPRRIIWIGGTLLLTLIVMIIAVSAGAVVWGLLFTLLLWVLVGWKAIWPGYEDRKTTGVAIGFRQFSFNWAAWRKRNQGVANDKADRPAIITEIGRVDFLKYPLTDSKVLGIAWDHRHNSYSATMVCSFQSLYGEDRFVQDQRQAAFARLLNGMAETGNLIERLSWRWQTLLGEHADPQAEVDHMRAGSNLTRHDCPNRQTYLERSAEMGQAAITHRVTMTLSIDGSDSQTRRLAKSAGGMPALLVQQLDQFYALVKGSNGSDSPIGLKAANFLSYNDLVLENLLALNPVRGQPLWQRDGWDGPVSEHDFLSQQLAWPESHLFLKDGTELGQTYHQSFILWEFTRSGFLAKQWWDILEAPIPKIVAVIFGVVPTQMALTRSEWSANAAVNSAKERTRSDRRLRATDVLAQDRSEEREMEIASSQGEDGLTACYIDVWGATPAERDANVQRLYRASNQARFVIMPLNHRQFRGIEAVMPIGRGLGYPVSKLLKAMSK